MLLFSTMLSFSERLTKDSLIELVIRWNQGSPYAENNVSDINWNGEHNARYGDDKTWLDIQEYRNKNILAFRYEHTDGEGVVWDTDIIANYDMRKISIQLQRSFLKEAYVNDTRFSIPRIISMLIDEEYLEHDNGLPVDRCPYIITDDRIGTLAGIINRKKTYDLPVVVVSKRFADNDDPIDTELLAERLRGVAHVIVYQNSWQISEIRELCNDENEYNGAIGVYVPSGYPGYRRFMSRTGEIKDHALYTRVLGYVMQSTRIQKIPELYTYYGVINALLRDRLQSREEQRNKAELANTDYENMLKEAFEYIDSLELQVSQFKADRDALREESMNYYKEKSASDNEPLLYYGNEIDLCTDEVKEFVLDAISSAISNIPDSENSRRRDVLRDVLNSNDYQEMNKKRHNQIKQILKGYRKIDKKITRELKNLGIQYTEEGKHYKLKYHDDDRYPVTLTKTASDDRTGKNSAQKIINVMM